MIRRLLIPLAVLSLAPMSVAAHAAVASSPKPAPVPARPPALEVNADYELRGFFGAGDMLEVSVSKKGAASSDWIPVGRKRGAVTIVSASSNEGTAVILVSGKRSLLRLAGAGAGEATASKEITAADLSDAKEYLTSLQQNMTDEQGRVMMIEFMSRVAADKELSAAVEAAQKSDGSISSAESLRLGVLIMPAMGESFAKAMELPGKDGAVHAMPRSLDRVFHSPDALKRLMEENETEPETFTK